MHSITRILKTNKHLQRSRDPDMGIETFTPRRPKHIQMARAISASSSSPASNLRSSIQSSSPALTSATLTTRVHHMPFEPPALGFESLNAQSSRPMSQVSTELDSPVSSSFPRFADPPPASSSTSIDRERITVESTSPTPGEDWREILGAAPESPDPDKASSLRWGGDGDKSEFDHPKGSDFFVEDDESGTYTNRPVSRSMGSTYTLSISREYFTDFYSYYAEETAPSHSYASCVPDYQLSIVRHRHSFFYVFGIDADSRQSFHNRSTTFIYFNIY
ncbi:hypothetical protein H0H81_005480 [Sphagnurus paluster]|uniref:Uncharacterized protein n=1 Tax=Sphagnurus paluster TaxID=117069 RepID=A0A9P7K3V7_9AGAR|nr:hypothetical protein H0H81_005480 [Sphagnurus paluster]